MEENQFTFALGDYVRIVTSDERGFVIGRAEYSTGASPSYLVRYRAADGRATEAWWTGDALLVEA